METKLFTILDRCTEIPAMATRMMSDNYIEWSILHKAGYGGKDGRGYVCIFLSMISSCRSAYEPYAWELSHAVRTMPCAHEYIENNWNKLKSGDIIDVEIILGEKS